MSTVQLKRSNNSYVMSFHMTSDMGHWMNVDLTVQSYSHGNLYPLRFPINRASFELTAIEFT